MQWREKNNRCRPNIKVNIVIYIYDIHISSIHVSEVLPICRVDRKVQWWDCRRRLVWKPCFQLLEIFKTNYLRWNFQNYLSASGQVAGDVSLSRFHAVFCLNSIIILRCSGAPGIDVGLWSADGTWTWLTSPFSRTWFILTKISLVRLNPYNHRVVLIVFK